MVQLYVLTVYHLHSCDIHVIHVEYFFIYHLFNFKCVNMEIDVDINIVIVIRGDIKIPHSRMTKTCWKNIGNLFVKCM